MIKLFLKTIVIFSAVFVFGVSKSNAAFLDNGYLITNTVISNFVSNSNTTSLAIEGIVYPVVENSNPSSVQMYYKVQEVGAMLSSSMPNFSPLASGNFSTVINNLNCGSTYNFWLYEVPNSLISVDTMNGNGQLSPAFQIPITCPNQQPTNTGGDQMVPLSAGAQSIAGVNWGNMNVTDHSISVSNAYVIPIQYGGPKKFKIEYGTGSANNNNQPSGGEFLGFSGEITKNPPYTFSFQIGALIPNTNYYLNLWEVTPDGVSTNLLVYTFTLTNQSTNNYVINYTTPSSTSINVYGNLINDSGVPLNGVPITIELRQTNDENSSLIQSFNTTTSSNDIINGNAFYQNVFSGLTPDTVYFIFLRNASTNAILAGPVEAITPSANQVIPDTNPVMPTYDGLIACGGVDCDFNTFIETINRVINFLIVYIAFPVVAIVVAWAGLMLILSGGNTSKKEYAKSIISKILIGFIIALLCWSIIKFILILMGYVPTGPLWEILGTTPTN